MKKLIWFILILGIILFLANGCSSQVNDNKGPGGAENQESTNAATETGQIKIKSISGEELVAKNNGSDKDAYLLIDVRTVDEYKAGHIANAINLPLTELANQLSLIEDFKEKPIIVYCNTGNRSGQASKILLQNGFQDISDAEGVKEYTYDLVTYIDTRASQILKMVD